MPVPLDYDRPRGAKIPIALTRLRATDTRRRLGSVFVNPGGPGASGVEFVVGLGSVLGTDELRARFDLVGFDPKGIIRSAPLRCFDSPEEWDPYFTPFAFPLTREQERQWIAADRYLTSACDRRGGPIIDHVATANAARDLDVLRAAATRARSPAALPTASPLSRASSAGSRSRSLSPTAPPGCSTTRT